MTKKLEKERRQKTIDAYLASQFGEKKEEYKAGDVVLVEFYSPGVDGAEVELTITNVNEKQLIGFIRRGAAMGGREVSRTYNREDIKKITLKR